MAAILGPALHPYTPPPFLVSSRLFSSLCPTQPKPTQPSPFATCETWFCFLYFANLLSQHFSFTSQGSKLKFTGAAEMTAAYLEMWMAKLFETFTMLVCIYLSIPFPPFWSAYKVLVNSWSRPLFWPLTKEAIIPTTCREGKAFGNSRESIASGLTNITGFCFEPFPLSIPVECGLSRRY